MPQAQISLRDAIDDFPVVRWSQEHFTVHATEGENFYADCPICGGKRRLGISQSLKLFHCFRCDEGGHGSPTWNGRANLVQMIGLIEHLSVREAIIKIYEMSGFSDVVLDRVKAEIPSRIIPDEAIELIKQPLTIDVSQWLAVDRRVPQLINTSWVCVQGRYADRVIFPIKAKGQLVGFEAKSYYPGIKPPSLFPPWFYKSSYIYQGLTWVPHFPDCVITESVIDAETITGSNAIGIFGSSLSDAQLNCLLHLRKDGVRRLYWMLDADAWKKQAKAILEKTISFFENYFVKLPPGSDPNSLGYQECLRLKNVALKVESELDLVELFL